jgi:N-acetylglucosaminyldiphosphoundecaprenol N-acetyl-beta-D-mannosaminyltransferase
MTPPPVPRYNLLGVGVSVIDYEAAADRIMQAAHAALPFSASALAVHAIMEAQGDPSYRARLNSLDLALPDGQPVRWALNWLYAASLRDRVYGPFLMRALCANAAREGVPIFLFGTTPTVLEALSSNLSARNPGIRIAGARASRFRRASEAEAKEDARVISDSGARLVFCGLGCPRQEAWAHAMRPLIMAPIVGVGAAFALWAGERTMAPPWMQNNGFEWLYRLGQEPRRLAKRYIIDGPEYFLKIARQKFGGVQPDDACSAVSPDYWG